MSCLFRQNNRITISLICGVMCVLIVEMDLLSNCLLNASAVTEWIRVRKVAVEAETGIRVERGCVRVCVCVCVFVYERILCTHPDF